MRKLTLDIEQLRVETFDVDGSDRAEGTVFAQQQWTAYCTANVGYLCDQPTNWKLDANCHDSIAPANCTNVCPSGPLVCDTSVDVCG